jgi:4-hydroxyacetophenone monooxygenase
VTDRSTAVTRGELESRLQAANIPALLVALYQLTGDRAWLEEPYRPTRSQGMDLNQSGGLDEERQGAVRSAAATAFLAWWAGAEPAVPEPSGGELARLLSAAMGEPVPPEYEDMMAVELGFRVIPRPGPPPDDPDFFVVIIGAGFSGLLAALRLRDLGIRHVVLEKDDGIGGTWWENRYPGAGVDTPSHLYSYSFFIRPWPAHFARREQVEAYLRDFAHTYNLWPSVRLRTEVASARFSPEDQRWTVTTTAGQTWRANAVISAVGQLNRPKLPDIPGLDGFTGTLAHSARWPAGVAVGGKRVGIVGTGASAMQIVPAIAADVRQLAVFQRSPQWIAPSGDYFRPIGADAQWLMNHYPFYRAWYRARLAWIFNDKVYASLQKDPSWAYPERSVNAINDAHRRFFTRYLEAELHGREDLISKSLPGYPPFGKRMLLDNGWFAALRRPHVKLVTEPIEAVTATGIRTSGGQEYRLDVLVVATGFHTQQLLYPMEIRGRSGQTLRDYWDGDDAHAYLGITVPTFPNLFLVLGPNTGLGHGGSVVTIVEMQIDYIARLLSAMIAGRVSALECRADIEATYTQRVRAAHENMVWSHPGMTNWYRNSRGRVTSTLPWRIVDYRAMLAEPDFGDFILGPAPAARRTPAKRS